MNTPKRHNLVLAIYPNTRGFAFVAFEGPLAPVDWGIKEIRGRRKNQRCLVSIGAIIERCEPAVFVLQDTSPTGTRRARRIRDLNAEIAEFAEHCGIPVYSYSRARVREAFEPLGLANKHSLAEAIAKHIPAFERYLPPMRKPWMSEDARMGLFDAAALALTYFQSAVGGQEMA